MALVGLLPRPVPPSQFGHQRLFALGNRALGLWPGLQCTCPDLRLRVHRLQHTMGGAHHRRIDADRRGGRCGAFIGGVQGFAAQRLDFTGCVFALQRGEIHHRDGKTQGEHFRLLFDTTSGVFRHAFLHAHGIHRSYLMNQLAQGYRRCRRHGRMMRHANVSAKRENVRVDGCFLQDRTCTHGECR